MPGYAPAAKSGSTVKSAPPSKLRGQDLFDARIWNDPTSTAVFYRFMASLRKRIREDVSHTTPVHKFIRTLRDGGRLVRCYTQNIDGLEARDGLCTDLNRGKGNRARFTKKVLAKPRPDGPTCPGSESDGGCEVVQLHGDLNDLRCGLCQGLCAWEDDKRGAALLCGRAPRCQPCTLKSEERLVRGKRGTAIGVLRPNVVLYGEEHPSAQALSTVITHDMKLLPDVLLIIGTSLRVHGLKTMVKEFAKAVHSRRGGGGTVIFVNKTKPAESIWSNVIDYWVEMDCDAWVDDLRGRRGDLWERQGTLKLPIQKELPREEKCRPSTKKKACLQDAGEGKENIAISIPGKIKSIKDKVISASTLKRVTGAAEAVGRWKKNARTVQPLSTLTDATTNSQPFQDAEIMLQPSTPRKSTAGNRADQTKSQYLPTPPPSGRNRPSLIGTSKRGVETLLEEELPSTRSSKRRRTVDVLVEPEAKRATDVPSSRAAVDIEPMKRAVETFQEEELPSTRLSKRRRTVDVWIDSEAAGDTETSNEEEAVDRDQRFSSLSTQVYKVLHG